MQKISLLFMKHLSIALLISVLFLSIPQQALPSTVYSISISNAAAAPATNLTLGFSTFIGGSDVDHGRGVAVTKEGYCYVTGRTESSDFPTKNAYNSTYGGGGDAFLTRFVANGSLFWSTYLGGSKLDNSYCISVAYDGSCFITGNTNSSDFPTKNAYDSAFNGGYLDIYVAKFSSNGSLLWSTYLGGSDTDYAASIAVAHDGSCFVIGDTRSKDFPIKNAYDSTHNGSREAFVSKFDTNGSLLWSTYLGGSYNDFAGDVAVTEDGSCYVTGITYSEDFPIMNAFDSTYNGDLDAFITKFSAQGEILWSTFLGGIYWDDALGIAAAMDGSCYVTGFTILDFPIQNAYDSTYDDWGDAFVTKFAANGTLLWSTFLGGNDIDRGRDIVTTIDGSCYVIGETASTNFPMKNAYDSSVNGVFDVFVTKFSSEGFLLWSTYLGGISSDKGYGIAVTEDGSCFITGATSSDDFPMQNAFDNIYEMSEGFVTAFIEPLQPSTQPVYLYGILASLVITLLIVLILNRKRK
ncbi:MAG: hypothetical protein FK730_08085 [Asgard group archaeon]|nr:hypothetical protein [Asgard group archaeon]